MSIIDTIKQMVHLCMRKGCYSRHTHEYEYPDGQLVRYCFNHNKNFCIWCGQFWAGVEDFEFSANQICSNCRCRDCGEPEDLCTCDYESDDVIEAEYIDDYDY